MKRASLFWCIALLYFTSGILPASVPKEWEPAFVKASLSYRERDYASALQSLESLEKNLPNSIDVVELKALTLKSSGANELARKEYLRLYSNAKRAGNFSRGKGSVYAFELGAISLRMGQPKEAKKYLEESIRANFNKSASHFLLGKSYLEMGELSQAESHFTEVVNSETESLKPMAKLFLAQVSGKQSRSSDSLNYFIEARSLAAENLAQSSLSEEAKELSRRVLTTADKELRSYDKNTFFADVSLTTAYDSNVLSVPNSDASAGTSPSSLKETLGWGLGYSSSPILNWQFVGSYKGSVNHNTNAVTRSGQFFTHDATLYFTHDALRPSQFGFKAAGSGVLQYQINAFKPYSLEGSFGPYLKQRLNSTWWLGAETFFEPVKNYLDPTLSSGLRKSGWEQTAKVYVASGRPDFYFTPGAYFTATLMRPEGEEFRGYKTALDLANTMYLSSRWILSQSAGVTTAWYPERSVSDRTDQILSGGVSAGFRVTTGFTLVAAGQYLRNFSSDGSYRYSRLLALLSAGYNF
jgi:hypothetical protein